MTNFFVLGLVTDTHKKILYKRIARSFSTMGYLILRMHSADRTEKDNPFD